jgi:hypothetical protein
MKLLAVLSASAFGLSRGQYVYEQRWFTQHLDHFNCAFASQDAVNMAMQTVRPSLV